MIPEEYRALAERRRALTTEEREALSEPRSHIAGGVVGYVQRIRAEHWPWFSRREDGSLIYRGCICQDVICRHVLHVVHEVDLLAAYEAKVEDFAAETRANSALLDANEALRGQIEAVRALHFARPWKWGAGGDCCNDCELAWPCRTAAALSVPAVPEEKDHA